MNSSPFRALLLSAVLFFAALQPSRASAQETAEGPKIDLAKVYMEEAQEHYLAGRYNEAAITFMKAYSVVPLSAFLFNTGVSYEKIKMYKHAAEFFERYLDAEKDAVDKDKILARIADLKEKAKSQPEPEEPPEPPPAIVVEEVECGKEGALPCPQEPPKGSASEMKSLINVRTTPPDAKTTIVGFPEVPVGEGTSPYTQTIEQGKYKITVEHPKYKTVDTVLDVKGGRIYVVVVEMSQGSFLGYLTVRTVKPGAEVYLDTKEGGSIGQTPLGLPLPAGKHTIWVELAGFKPVEKDMDIVLGEETALKLVMDRVDYGILSVKTNVDKSLVIIDGMLKKGAPLAEQLTPGSHHVQVKSKGMKSIKQEIKIEKGMQTTLLVRLNPKPKRTYAWVSFGLAAALITTGAVLAYYAGSVKDELDRDASLGYLQSDDPRPMKGLGLSIGADASFVLGGILGVVGIYYLVKDKLPDSEYKLAGPEDLADMTGGHE